MSKKNNILQITPFVYGTTRLGDDKIPFEERVRIARLAMNSGVWFHTSDMYGSALQVLGEAFNRDRTRIPKLIIKIGYNSIDEIREVLQRNLKPLGIESLELGQLCLAGDLAEDFANGGKCYEGFEKLKEEGLVKNFVVEVFPWTSEAPYRALKAGYTKNIIDGFIFYLNPLQRFAANKLWDLLNERQENIIAMRTVSGGPVHKLRDVPGFAWKQYLHDRAVEVAPIFEDSGIKSWTEFCVRFVHSFPLVLATVGSTGREENLNEFLSAKENIKHLPKETLDEIVKLHYRWSDETDIHAEHWSM